MPRITLPPRGRAGLLLRPDTAGVVRLSVVEGHLRVAASECLGFVRATVLGGLWSLLFTSYHLDSPRPRKALTGTHQRTLSQDPGFCSHGAFDLQIPAVKLPILP